MTPLPAFASRGQRAGLVVGAFLLALSLGLPWVVAVERPAGSAAPLRAVPGPLVCHPEVDAVGDTRYVCVPDLPLEAWADIQRGETVIVGAAHGSRFGVIAALVLLALGWRRNQRRYLLIAGGVVAVSTVLTAGLGVGSAGAGAAWLAVVVLLAAGGRPGWRWDVARAWQSATPSTHTAPQWKPSDHPPPTA
ncbi:MAG: hypothetical protein V4739_00875 [Pseudomonadota bacterium]